jgi:hypothetical protein
MGRRVPRSTSAGSGPKDISQRAFVVGANSSSRLQSVDERTSAPPGTLHTLPPKYISSIRALMSAVPSAENARRSTLSSL